MGNFFGMVDTSQFTDAERPKDWRETILALYPNGDAPLTAMLALMGKEKTTDPLFNWWTDLLQEKSGVVTNIYTDSLMTVEYVSGAVAGDVLYVKVPEATAQFFRAKHQILLRDADDPYVDCNGKVLDVLRAGANSKLTVRLLEDDDNSTAHDLSDCDRAIVNGNINAEGAPMPDSIAYRPTKVYNKTQIFRTPLEITRTADMTKYRTGDKYKYDKKKALEDHSIEMEMAFLFSIMSEQMGDNGHPERTTNGIIPFIKEYGTTDDFRTSAFVGSGSTSWLNGGEEWLDAICENIFRYGSEERMCYCGSTFISAVNKLVKSKGNYQLMPMTKAYGIKVVEWTTPFGTIYLKRHPLFSYEPTTQRSALIIDPSDIMYRYITDTTFYADKAQTNGGQGRIDGKKEEYLTEAGLEYHHPVKAAYITGAGLDQS